MKGKTGIYHLLTRTTMSPKHSFAKKYTWKMNGGNRH